jgi:hypothetical protein
MMKYRNTDRSQQALDAVNIFAGVALALSPWLLGYVAESTAMWSAWVAGAIMTLIAAGALFAFRQYEEWANLVVGLWTVAAPWVLGFAGIAAAMWSHVLAGVVVAALAAVGLWFAGNRPLSSA